ncbi:hypothetical protein QT343_25660 [Escherichia coli]|nr:hypothetical protein [Escherichia coli]
MHTFHVLLSTSTLVLKSRAADASCCPGDQFHHVDVWTPDTLVGHPPEVNAVHSASPPRRLAARPSGLGTPGSVNGMIDLYPPVGRG